MIAIVIHYLGFYVVNAMIPAWASEVDGELASIWYLSFACIDIMALAITRQPAIKLILAASCAWSATLAIETWLLQDYLQSADFAAQYLFDGLLVAMLLVQLWFYAMDRRQFRISQRSS